MISVLIVTFNHSLYIKECIESVLKQKLEVPLELVIVDDGSTDGTSEIIQEIYVDNLDRIKWLQLDPNQGIEEAFFQGFRLIAHPYAVVMDGDDKFLNYNKLQFQYDFLKSQPHYKGVAHAVEERVERNTQDFIPFLNHREQDITYRQIGLNRIFHTNTLMFRTEVLKKVLPCKSYFYCHDILLTNLILETGDIKYFDYQWSIYRRHSSSNTVSQDAQRYFKTIFALNKSLLNRSVSMRLKSQYLKGLQLCLHQWACWGSRNGKLILGWSWALINLRNPLKWGVKQRLYPLVLILRNYIRL
jgi:glycosyltransferase involved in cell wall biosynthesis